MFLTSLANLSATLLISLGLFMFYPNHKKKIYQQLTGYGCAYNRLEGVLPFSRVPYILTLVPSFRRWATALFIIFLIIFFVDIQLI